MKKVLRWEVLEMSLRNFAFKAACTNLSIAHWPKHYQSQGATAFKNVGTGL